MRLNKLLEAVYKGFTLSSSGMEEERTSGLVYWGETE